VTSNHFWWFEIPKHSLYFIIFCVMQVFWFYMFWVWILALFEWVNLLVWMVVYHSGYFYVMCCECGDINGYTYRHKITQQMFCNAWWPCLMGKFKFIYIGTKFKYINLNMYLFYLLNIHNKKKCKRYGLSKLNIMGCSLDNNFLYGFWNGPIIYDVLVRDLILVK
jgi:hypothetical protein